MSKINNKQSIVIPLYIEQWCKSSGSIVLLYMSRIRFTIDDKGLFSKIWNIFVWLATVMNYYWDLLVHWFIVVAGAGAVTNGGGGDGSGQFTSRAPTSFVPYVTGKCQYLHHQGWFVIITQSSWTEGLGFGFVPNDSW